MTYKRWSWKPSNSSFPIAIGINFSVTGSQFGFPDINLMFRNPHFIFGIIDGIESFQV